MRQQQPLAHPNTAIRGNNHLVLGYLHQVQLCIKQLEKMELHVINVHFENIKPKVRVQPCLKTYELQQSQQALCYICGNDNRKFEEYQMMVEGIKVVWRHYPIH